MGPVLVSGELVRTERQRERMYGENKGEAWEGKKNVWEKSEWEGGRSDLKVGGRKDLFNSETPSHTTRPKKKRKRGTPNLNLATERSYSSYRRTETQSMQSLTTNTVPRHSAGVKGTPRCTQKGGITGKPNYELVSGSEISLLTFTLSFKEENFISSTLCLLLTAAVPDHQHKGDVQHALLYVSHCRRVSWSSTRKYYLNFETPVLGLHEYSSLLRHYQQTVMRLRRSLLPQSYPSRSEFS